MKSRVISAENAGQSVFWNKRVKSLSPYVPGEQPRTAGLVKLNTNENPYPPSPKVIEAIRQAAAENLRLYPDPACTAFREAVAEKYGVKPEQVFAGNGSDEVLAFAFGAFFEAAPPPVLFPDITYSFYPVYAKLWGIPFSEVPLRENFTIDTGAYDGGGGAIFPNPNAPTGVALPVNAITGLAGRLFSQNKVLIVDEAYAAFGAESAVPFIDENPNLLTVHTLSKAASLAGLRAGFAIGQRPLIEALERVRDSFNSYTMDAIAQAAARAAILDSAYYDAVNQRVIKTRERAAAALAGMGFTSLPSSANFIFTKPPPTLGAKRLFAILRENGVLVRHFDRPRTGDYLRVSIGSDSGMDKFLEVCKNSGKADN
ncbi:MAG: aminotransferase class I/II-fold pyridoxal phosphate-dependent enzyme [Spirochaetaceae bacterium]|jgi:histidinol-phosphate aminotransferase|nr:aminotransferase class I/II-fold pyridoxal phosphate-dependent enzyme [Spirochaetaceae bacterium]